MIIYVFFTMSSLCALFGTYIFVIVLFRAIIDYRRASADLLKQRLMLQAYDARQEQMAALYAAPTTQRREWR